jgi:hypothetical protein
MARLQLLNVSGVEMRDLNVVAELRELWLKKLNDSPGRRAEVSSPG